MSTEAKHTPGPWHANKSGYVYGPDCVVAKCGDFADAELKRYNAARWNADARLIARAPEMAEQIARLEAEKAELVEALGDADYLLDNAMDNTANYEAAKDWYAECGRVQTIITALLAKHKHKGW